MINLYLMRRVDIKCNILYDIYALYYNKYFFYVLTHTYIYIYIYVCVC